MPNRKLRAVIIGLGGIAWKYDYTNPASEFALTQAGAMLRHPDIELCGGYSPNEIDRNGFQTWSGIPAFNDIEQLLNEIQPDIAGICSPTEVHAENFEQCINKDVSGIWLEKPPTKLVKDITRLAELAEYKKTTVCVNYFRRYLPVYDWLKNIPNEIGSCKLIQLLYSPGLERNGSHFLDLIFFLTGAVDYNLLWVESNGDINNPAFALRLNTGQLVSACGANLPYHSNTIVMVCEGGVATVGKGGEIVRLESRTENSLFPGFYTLQDASHNLSDFGGMRCYMEYPLRDLVDSIQNKKTCRSSLYTAMKSQILLEDILYKANK